MDIGTAGIGTYFHTGTGHFCNYGTTSIPVPDTSVTSVRHAYRYWAYRYRTEHPIENIPRFKSLVTCPSTFNVG